MKALTYHRKYKGVRSSVHSDRESEERKERVSHFHRLFFDFTQLKPTDTWPRDRCGRAQLVLLPSLADSLRLGADL